MSGRLDSNQRPPAPKAGAITDYATPRKYIKKRKAKTNSFDLPDTSGRDNRLRYAPKPENIIKNIKQELTPSTFPIHRDAITETLRPENIIKNIKQKLTPSTFPIPSRFHPDTSG